MYTHTHTHMHPRRFEHHPLVTLEYQYHRIMVYAPSLTYLFMEAFIYERKKVIHSSILKLRMETNLLFHSLYSLPCPYPLSTC